MAVLTQAYADFVAAGVPDRLPEAVVEVVRLGFTDAVGVMVAGRHEPAVEALLRYARGRKLAGRARLLLGGETTAAAEAALVDATAAHALDYDDYAFSNHPSAVLVPTVLAAAAEAGADGPAMVAGYVAGYEVWADLMLREPDHLHSKGWHPTAVFGPVAAAAAAARVHRLDAATGRNALALAASLSGGVMENFGTMAKPYHGGRAAEAGLTGVALAMAGMTASAQAIEGPRGLLRALSPAGRVDLESPVPFGREWRIARLRLNIKKYPTVGASQRCIDSILAQLAATPVEIAAIERIVPVVSTKHAAVMPFHRPRTALEAKFSLEFAVACALLHGRVGLRELRDEVVNDPALQSLMAKVEIETTDEYDPDYPVAAPFDTVRVALRDGRRLETPPVRRARGHADAPLSAAELQGKFIDCLAAGGTETALADRLFRALQRIDALTGPADLPTVN